MSKWRVGIAATAVLALAAPLTMLSEGYRAQTYLDPVKIPTRCWGHAGPDTRLGQWTPETECRTLLDADLRAALAAVDRCAPGLPAQMRAAFTDFALNAGGGAFCSSSMARLARAGDWAGACSALSRWVYAGGKVLPGLVTRRAREQRMCEAGL